MRTSYRFLPWLNIIVVISILLTTLPSPPIAVAAEMQVVVTVADTNSSPEVGLPVYAFDGTTYTGYNGTTDASGQATLTLPVGDYRFRSDKNGTQFWSGTANHCTVPGCTSATVTTTIPLAVMVTDTNGAPEAGLAVYAFDGTTYTGYNKTTDGSGQAVFTLPQGNYRFRSDKNGTQFWSGTANHCTVPGCTTAVVTTTIPLTVTVADTNGAPEMGLAVYAFDGTTYTGYNKTTDGSGQAVFTLPQGNYRFRSDKNGTQFWSGTANHCTVPGCTGANITLPASPTATLTAANDGPTSLGGVTTLTATLTPADDATYAWNLGDGTTGSGAILTHTYPAAGVYTAAVTASVTDGSLTAATTVIVDEMITGLVASNSSPAPMGGTIMFSATATAGSNVAYTWAFGDGMTGSGAVVNHDYPITGTYATVVTASNSISVVTATTVAAIFDPLVWTVKTSGVFGWSVSTAGDVNGDGYDDVVVGDPYYSNDHGRVLVFYGSAAGLSMTANWTAVGNQEHACLGQSVSTAGDVNGDGYDDIIVGATATFDGLHGSGDIPNGWAYVYYGSASGLSTTPDWIAEGERLGDQFGYSVSTAGDVNGDGYDEVIVGAPYSPGPYVSGDVGRAYLYYGSNAGLGFTSPLTIENTGSDEYRFGYSVSTAGDVNGDGYSDVIVGRPYRPSGPGGAGASGDAVVYYGSATGLDLTTEQVIPWEGQSEWGRSVDGAGDTNGDGYADVIIGSAFSAWFKIRYCPSFPLMDFIRQGKQGFDL